MKTKIYNKTSIPVFAILALILFGATNIKAAPGDLDLTFGSGGIVITRGNTLNNLNTASAMAIQADGKIVVVGDGSIVGPTWDFAVVRYNPDGSLDTSFGGSGIVITPVGNSNDEATSVAIQADGKIVVVGDICNGVGDCSSAGTSIAVVRYNPNGSLDTSFNGTGKVITSVGDSLGDYAHSVAIQTDGKIVVAGSSRNGSNDNFALVRYNTDGSLDTTFNGTGKVITPVSGGNFGGGTNSVAIQSDGKIIAAGGSQDGFSAFTLVRYNTDGTLDTSFNGTGKVITPVGNSDSGASGLAIQPDGKIVAAGYSRGVTGDFKTDDFAVVRYNPNGSLDTTFSGTGKIIIPIGNSYDYANSVAIQSDGKIVAVGYSGKNVGSVGSDFAVVRYNPNGSLDTTFNGTGKVITPVGNSQDYAGAVAIQADGKIVVAGGTDDLLYDFYDFAVVRYQGGSNANIRTRFDFDGDGKADISVFRPTNRVWYLNQSTAGVSTTQFGLSTDNITPADYDGDGRTDISVFRGGVWYRLNSSNGTVGIVQFGLATDIPVPADYTGDGRAELAVYRNGVWWSYNLTNNQINVVQFGLSTDKPVAADYDGDGRADQAVYRNGEWHINRSSQGYTVVNFGLATDKLVPADYDGDGKTDLAVYRAGTWYVLQSSNGFTAFPFGLVTDIPAPADYDGDGKVDAAVYRNGTWYLRQSTNGVSVQQFGLPNDQPIPAINAGNNSFVDGIENSEISEKRSKSEVVLATKTWDGGGATKNWSEAANWSGDTVPLATDSVVFDVTSVKNVTIDVNITVSAWQIAAGYTGTISPGTSTVTVNGSFSQSGGTFTGGSVLLDFNQPFTQNGGIFTASSGTTAFGSSLNLSGGTFNHNSGTVVFDNSSNLNLSATLNLNNLTINGNAVFQTNGTIVVPGTLTLTNGSVSNTSAAVTGIINATGNVSIAATYNGGTTNVLIDGASTRTVTFPAGAVIPGLTVNSANVTLDTSGSGTVTFQSAVDLQNIAGFTFSTNLTIQNSFTYGAAATMSGSGNITVGIFTSFTQSNGTITLLGASTFTANASTFTQSGGTFTGGSGAIDFNSVFTQSGGTFTASTGTTSFAAATTIGGTFNHNGGTVLLDGSSNAGLTLQSTLNLNNLTINRSSSGAVIVDTNSTINVAGTLLLTDGQIASNTGTGTFNAVGDATIAATFDGGSANLMFSGAANQNLSGGGINPTGVWTINKSGGTLTLNNDLNISNGTNNLVLTDGTITTGTNSVIAGTRTITRTNGFINGNLRRTFSIAGSRQFDVGTINGYAPVTINATTGTFPATFTVGGKNGTLPSADATKSLTRNWSLTPSGITSANLTFQYLDTDVPMSANESNFKFLRNNGTISNEGITSINTAINIATLNGVTTFSDWSLGQLNPTAATAAISGRIITANGRGISRTRVLITDSTGETRTTMTNSFGYYRFDEIRAGETYVIQPHNKQYQFALQVITLNENMAELNFTAEP